MSVAAQTARPVPGRLTALELYRDDGLLASALGRSLGRRVRLPAAVLAVLAAVPPIAALAAGGDGLPDWAAAGAVGWFVVLAGLSSGRPQDGRLAWLVPPLLRAVEYALLVWLVMLAGASAAAAFALLAALAFRHYDAVYRLRYQAEAPAGWARLAGGGWDGRLIVACAFFLLDLLPGAFFVAAALLAVLSVGESVTGWLRFSRMQRPALYVDEEDENA